MTDAERNYQLYLLANHKAELENHLWGARTAAFLTASSFIFVGVIALLISEVTRILPLVVCLCGLFLCFLQNRNAWAARKGAGTWDVIMKETLKRMDADTSELISSVGTERNKIWGTLAPKWKRIFIPRWIHEYWMPGTISLIWVSTLVVIVIMIVKGGV